MNYIVFKNIKIKLVQIGQTYRIIAINPRGFNTRVYTQKLRQNQFVCDIHHFGKFVCDR